MVCFALITLEKYKFFIKRQKEYIQKPQKLKVREIRYNEDKDKAFQIRQ